MLIVLNSRGETSPESGGDNGNEAEQKASHDMMMLGNRLSLSSREREVVLDILYSRIYEQSKDWDRMKHDNQM